MRKRTKHTANKRLWIALAVLCVVALAAGAWYWRQHSKESEQPVVQNVTGTPSQPTEHQIPTNSPTGQGGVTDNNGQVTGSLPPASQWKSSTSGKITLQQPTAGSTVSSGATLSGLAQVDTVQFILKDNAVGQIAQGTLNVVNGKFSGTLQFTPHAKTGELELYYPNPNNGAEEDIVNIDVNFNY
jgi:hypothetical protein